MFYRKPADDAPQANGNSVRPPRFGAPPAHIRAAPAHVGAPRPPPQQAAAAAMARVPPSSTPPTSSLAFAERIDAVLAAVDDFVQANIEPKVQRSRHLELQTRLDNEFYAIQSDGSSAWTPVQRLKSVDMVCQLYEVRFLLQFSRFKPLASAFCSASVIHALLPSATNIFRHFFADAKVRVWRTTSA